MKRTFVAGAVALALAACSGNPYSQFYQRTRIDPAGIVRGAPITDAPQVVRVSSFEAVSAYERKGYVPIGYSAFTGGGRVDSDDAQETGAEVGADLVAVIDPRYLGTETSKVPITLPTATTSTTSTTGTVTGSGGTANVYGNSTTTTYGTSTTYLPVAVKQYSYGAVYLVKTRTLLGVRYRELNDQERSKIQSNKGAMVDLVIDDSPAFTADVLVGDIIVGIDAQEVLGAASLGNLLAQRRGQLIELLILRGESKVSKKLHLPQ